MTDISCWGRDVRLVIRAEVVPGSILYTSIWVLQDEVSSGSWWYLQYVCWRFVIAILDFVAAKVSSFSQYLVTRPQRCVSSRLWFYTAVSFRAFQCSLAQSG